MTGTADFEVWCDGEFVASACGPREEAMREALHYGAQYAPDGPIEYFEVTRTKVVINSIAGNFGWEKVWTE